MSYFESEEMRRTQALKQRTDSLQHMFNSLERQVQMRFEYLEARHKADEQKTERMHMFLKEKAGDLSRLGAGGSSGYPDAGYGYGFGSSHEALSHLEEQMRGLLGVFM